MNEFLENIGFGKKYRDFVNIEKGAKFEIRRVISVQKERYILSDGAKEFRGELVGKLIYSADSPLDYPTVGDWVYVDSFDNEEISLIHEILPRKTLLKRKTAGKKIDFQLVAANIEAAFLIQSLDKNFNINRLERYLVMIHESKIQPIVLLSKSDLLSEESVRRKVNEVKELFPELQVHSFSNKNLFNIETIKTLLIPRQTYCMIGSSGVGKTTLLNILIGKAIFHTKPVREKDGRGRHATSSRQLVILDSGAMLIDTPGMRELGNVMTEKGIKETFLDISELSEKCHFKNCSHSNERDCAVLMAIKKGELSEKRYLNYIKLKKEAAFLDMSYQDKRNSDKKLGKFYKSVIKRKKIW